MPTTRKKVIKTVYKDEDDSEDEKAAGDFSDSGSEAEIPDQTSSEEDIEADASSAEEFDEKSVKSKRKFPQTKARKPKFTKDLISKINRQSSAGCDEDVVGAQTLFSIKDLTEEDKLLPSFLNLSESDSSDDESQKTTSKKQDFAPSSSSAKLASDSESETNTEYKDVWSLNTQEDSEEIAKKAFMELEQHKTRIEETKASILNYEVSQMKQDRLADVKDLLAQGEDVLPEKTSQKQKKKTKKARNDSDSEMEDWEEVKESKAIPQQGLQLIVDFPDAGCRKSKKIDIEMMMKRKINRVKKEYQVYMHKVHVLCWLGHGNYVSRVLNDQEVLAAALAMVPSKECYPGERVDMKYLEQITTWYKDKLTTKPDKNADKFRPKAPPLKEILLGQIKSRIVTNKKYLVFIFVSILRAIGLQCRVMFNFVALPIKPPSSELCSLSTKPKDEKKVVADTNLKEKTQNKSNKRNSNCKGKAKEKIAQVDGVEDIEVNTDNIMQLDGNDDVLVVKTRSARAKKANVVVHNDEDVSPPKRARRNPSPKPAKSAPATNIKGGPEKNTLKRAARKSTNVSEKEVSSLETANRDGKKPSKPSTNNQRKNDQEKESMDVDIKEELNVTSTTPRKTRITSKNTEVLSKSKPKSSKSMAVDIEKVKEQFNVTSTTATKTRTTSKNTESLNNSKPKSSATEKPKHRKINPPKITITNEKNETNTSSKYFNENKSTTKRLSLNRNRSQTVNPSTSLETDNKDIKPKSRTKSAPGTSVATSKYFSEVKESSSEVKRAKSTRINRKEEDKQRVSHRDLLAKNQTKSKNDVTGDLVSIIKKRVKEAKEDSKKGKVKVKVKQESEDDSDYLPEEEPNRRNSQSDEDFKPTKISPRPSTSRKIDRRVLSSDVDDELKNNKNDVWCEVFVEELEQWIAVDVIKGKVHCTKEIYNGATHPVCYIVGWDNNNYLKDLTRRYVPHWNTVTRKQRAEPLWWDKAIQPWLAPKTARDREEDEQLNRMQLEAPLPKSIAEYKNHPLYALKRHLLKFEVIYPPDAATLGFVRNEAVYARDCVYVCRSRDTWLKEAKVVRLGEQPYKIVKARPKWDKLSNKLITDKPLEVFGPWQVQDYEPPVAENGIVPRNAYGNVELFKDCMLPKGTVHIKLPGLNRVAKKLNIDCAPAMTGFDFNGGWSHPVYDGFVVCKEYEEIITEAWVKDQEDQERREREKIEARVYGNWRRLIRGLYIRERLKCKYGFEEPVAPAEKNKKGPRHVVKKK